MFERDLVFVGGGHTHALVMHKLITQPLVNTRVTLISDTVLTPYSGMLPGYMAGHYTKAQTHIDLNRLCQRANIRFIHDRVVGIDPVQKTVQLKLQADVAYDTVSINTGSTPNLNVPGAAEHGVGVKPVSQLTSAWQHLLNNSAKGQWAIIGAGAAGIEVVLGIAHRFKGNRRGPELSLVHSGDTILKGYEPKVRQKAYAALRSANIQVVSNFNVTSVTDTTIISLDGQQLMADQSIWCTPASAPSWPAVCGLATDAKGFIAVNEFLQSTSHEDVFACGDVATIIDDPRPKAGVYAVRSAPFLYKNLASIEQRTPMTPLKLQSDFLSLLSLGGQLGVGQRNGLSFSGHWVWRWKDYIDRKFMALFDAAPSPMAASHMPMQCAGCGSKLGPKLLFGTLGELDIVQRADVPNNLKKVEDSAVAFENDEVKVWQSIDGFRAFTDNMYLLGKVSVYHALNDSYAMGLTPVSAQVWPNLAFSHSRLAARDFKRLMQGVTAAMREHNTTLTGGHSTQGTETHLGVAVTAQGKNVWPKNAVQDGDWVLLNKPLGTGTLLSGDMQGKLSADGFEALWNALSADNLDFFKQLGGSNVHAATDVTGFGLIGHALEMVEQSAFSMFITLEDVPCLPEAIELAGQGIASSLAPQLLSFLSSCQINTSKKHLLPLLSDPQTNGGLLVSVDAVTGAALVKAGFASKIGEITDKQSHPIVIL